MANNNLKNLLQEVAEEKFKIPAWRVSRQGAYVESQRERIQKALDELSGSEFDPDSEQAKACRELLGLIQVEKTDKELMLGENSLLYELWLDNWKHPEVMQYVMFPYRRSDYAVECMQKGEIPMWY